MKGIPLGTKVYVPGIGYLIVNDRCRGYNALDVFVESKNNKCECVHTGIHGKVYVRWKE